MRAIIVRALGDPDVLTLGSTAVPQPGPGEVLARLYAVGVNFSDTERRRGTYDPPELPWIPGNEAAGVVEEAGPGVPSVDQREHGAGHPSAWYGAGGRDAGRRGGEAGSVRPAWSGGFVQAYTFSPRVSSLD